MSVPDGEIGEVLAIVSISEDLFPLRLARVDTDEFAVVLEWAHQISEELAIPVDVIAPAAATWRVVLDIDPNGSVDIIAIAIDHSADEIRGDIVGVLASAGEQVHIRD